MSHKLTALSEAARRRLLSALSEAARPRFLSGRILFSLLFFLFTALGLSAQTTVNWTVGYPKINPDPVVVYDVAYVELSFSVNDPSTNTTVVLTLPNDVVRDGTPIADIGHSTPALTGDGLTISLGDLTPSHMVNIRIPIKATICELPSSLNVGISVQSNGTPLTDGIQLIPISSTKPVFSGSFTALSSEFTTINEEQSVTYRIKTDNGDLAGGFYLTFAVSPYASLKDFKLNNVSVPPSMINSDYNNMRGEKVYTLWFGNLDWLQNAALPATNGKITNTPVDLTFTAVTLNTCGVKTITGNGWYPLLQANYDHGLAPIEACGVIVNSTFVMQMDELPGLPSLTWTSGSAGSHWGDVCWNGSQVNNTTDCWTTYRNNGGADAHNIQVTLSCNDDMFAQYFDLNSVWYSIDGGTRVEVNPVDITVTQTSGDLQFCRPDYNGKPVAIRIKVADPLPQGSTLKVGAGKIRGVFWKTDVVTNDRRSVIYNYFGGMISSTSLCGLPGQGDTGYKDFSFNQKIGFSNNQSAETETFRKGETKVMAQYIYLAGVWWDAYPQSFDFYVTLPDWLELDPDSANPMYMDTGAGSLNHAPPVSEGNNTYRIRVNTVPHPTNLHATLVLVCKATDSPSITEDIESELTYRIDWNLWNPINSPTDCIPTLPNVGRMNKSVNLVANETFVLEDFRFFRHTRGLKDSNGDGYPDDGTQALDNEINHHHFMAEDTAEIVWEGHIEGDPADEYTHIYATLNSDQFMFSNGWQPFAVLGPGSIEINGSRSSVTHTLSPDHHNIYVGHQATFKPGDRVKIVLPVICRAYSSGEHAIKGECWLSKTPQADPLNPPPGTRFGIDSKAFSLESYLQLNTPTWNETVIISDNNWTSTGNLQTYTNYLGARASAFPKEIRQTVLPISYTIEVPKGFELRPAISDQTSPPMYMYQQTEGDISRELTLLSSDNNTYVYDLESLYDAGYDGSRMLTAGKLSLPNCAEFTLIPRAGLRATKGAPPQTSTLWGHIKFKSLGNGQVHTHSRRLLINYAGESSVLNSMTDALDIIKSELYVPVLTVGNPNTVIMKNVWLYVEGNVKNLKITNIAGQSESGTGYQGRWIKVANEIPSSLTIQYSLDAEYTGGGDCNDNIRIYLASGYTSSWTPTIANPIDKTDLDHGGAICDIKLSIPPASVHGSLVVTNLEQDVPDGFIAFGKNQQLAASINSYDKSGVLKEAKMSITVPAGQFYVPNSATIAYPSDESNPPAVAPAFEAYLVSTLNADPSQPRTFEFDFAQAVGNPDALINGTGDSFQDKEARLCLTFTPGCDTRLNGIRYTGNVYGKNGCGEPAQGNGRLIYSHGQYPITVGSNYVFNIVNDFPDWRVVSPSLQSVAISSSITKSSGHDHVASDDKVELKMHRAFDLTGFSNSNSVSMSVAGSSVVGDERTVYLNFDKDFYNSASEGGVGQTMNCMFEFSFNPAAYTSTDGEEQPITIAVVSDRSFDNSCTPRIATMGSDESKVIVLLFDPASPTVCPSGTVSPVLSTVSSGTAYTYLWSTDEDANDLLDTGRAPSFSATAVGSTSETVYVSVESSVGYLLGRVSYTYSTHPNVTIAVSVPNAQCSESSEVDLTTTTVPTPSGSTILYYNDPEATSQVAGTTVHPINTTTYYAQATASTGCQSAVASILVTVHPTPAFGLSATTYSTCNATFDLLDLVSTYTSISSLNEVKCYSDLACTNSISTTVNAGGTYYLRAENALTGCVSAVQSVTVSLLEATTISLQPVGGATCAGDNITMHVTASGEGNLDYQWTKDGINIPTANADSYSTSTPGTYRVVVEGSCGSATSDPAVIDNHPATTILTESLDQSACASDAILLEVTASGQGQVTYQWYNTSGAIDLETGSTYSPTSAGNYYAKVNAECGEVTSRTIGVTINARPVPTIISGPLHVAEDQPATYTTQTGMTNYQWSVTGGMITSGQDQSTVNVTWGAVANDPGTISVTYYSQAGCSPTAPDSKEVSITTPSQPSFEGDFTVCAVSGNSYTYRTESGMNDYQWTVIGGTSTSGGDGSNEIVIEWDNAAIACSLEVTYEHPTYAPMTYTSTRVVTRQQLTTVTTDPIDGSACYGNRKLLDVQVLYEGPNTPTYKWYHNNLAIDNSDSPNYLASTAGNYKVEITGVCGSAMSNEAVVSIHALTTPNLVGDFSVYATQESYYVTDNNGSNYIWAHSDHGSKTADGGTGDYEITIQWGETGTGWISIRYTDGNGCPTALKQQTVRIDPQGTPSLVNVSGEYHVCHHTGGHVYQTDQDKYNYEWTVTGGTIVPRSDLWEVEVEWGSAGVGTVQVEWSEVDHAVTVPSGEMQIHIHDVPSIPLVAAPAGVCSGSPLTLTPPAILSGHFPVINNTRVWKLNGETFVSGSVVNAAHNGMTLVHQASNTCGTGVSAPVQVTVYDLPVVTTTPKTICRNESVDLRTTVTNPNGYTLRFFTRQTGGTALSSPIVNPAGPTTYYVEAQNGSSGCLSTSRTPIAIDFHADVFITLEPVSPSVVGIGNEFMLSVVALGNNLTYQWYKDGVALVHSTAGNSTLHVQGATESDYGSYHVEVTGLCGLPWVSSPVMVHILSPDATLKDLKVGGVTVAGFDPETENYTVAMDCDAETSNIIGTPNDSRASVNNPGNVSMVIGNNPFTITVTAENPLIRKTYTVNLLRDCYIPRIVKDLDDAIICRGETHTFEIEAEGENLSYEWYCGSRRILGANTNSYTVRNAKLSDYERYYVIVRSQFNNYKASAYSKKALLWVSDYLPETLRFSDYPKPAVTGKTYHIQLAGYEDVMQYRWDYSKDDVIFTPKAGGIGENETWATFGTLSAGAGMITATLEHPCGTRQVSQAIEVKYPLGVDRIAEASIQIYPNPTSGVLKISNTEAKQLVRILDASGAIKGTFLSQEGITTINLTNYAKGNYVLEYNGMTFKVIRK